MHLPPELLISLNDAPGFDEQRFRQVHESGEQVTSIRLNPAKQPPPITDLFKDQHATPVPWSQFGFYLDKRPSFTFDPLFHGGLYYVQEASSMFLEEAMKQTLDLSAALKVLDLSAAPGGKSTHIQSLITEASLLVSNDVIRARANTLKENMIKWGTGNVVVTNNDPADFSRLNEYFDCIVVDAPCSGSGLFRREPHAVEEWSEANVTLCSQRQQRILADIWPSLKKGGTLIYSTCSYSKEEDEQVVDWMLKELGATNRPLSVPTSWNITIASTAGGGTGYRFWPYNVQGEGFFLSCFSKPGDDEGYIVKPKPKAMPLSKAEMELVGKWANVENHRFIKAGETVYAWPAVLTADMDLLLSTLRVIYSGVRVGELMRDKLIPDHSLAMNGILRTDINKVSVEYDQAIRFLQRKDIVLEDAKRGWSLVYYQGYPLGWANILPNRINNYYPKELRILKDYQ